MERRVTFEGVNGPLVGRVHAPAGPARAWALFAHCFTCGKDINAAVRIGRALVEHGVGVLRFDFTGLGESGGDFEDATFSSNVDDLVRAADFLRGEHEAPALLVGHSLGGAAVLAAAHRIAECRAVVTIGAPSCPSHVKHLFEEDLGTIAEAGRATVRIAGRRFTVTRQLVDDLEETRLRARVRELGRALLVMHAPRDQVVGIDNARDLYVAAMHPKSFVSLDDADHLLTRERDARYAADVLAAWVDRYLPEARERAAPAPQGEVHVCSSREGFTTVARARGHRLVADEPADVGGDDLGMSPYELLLSSLGSCTVMTLRMYAERKGWRLDEVRVRLRHEKRHVDDCADCDDKPRKLDHIDKVVELAGDLDDVQLARLGEIAERCPVNRTLKSGEIRVSSEVRRLERAADQRGTTPA